MKSSFDIYIVLFPSNISHPHSTIWNYLISKAFNVIDHRVSCSAFCWRSQYINKQQKAQDTWN